MRFEGHMVRHGSWWAVEIPLLGVVTQARTRTEGYEMIKDAITVLAEPLAIDINIYPGKHGRFEVGTENSAALVAFFLRRQRQLQGVSLAEVSRRLGLKSRNAYARYEQGHAVPTIGKLMQLLKAVNPEQEFVLKKSA